MGGGGLNTLLCGKIFTSKWPKLFKNFSSRSYRNRQYNLKSKYFFKKPYKKIVFLSTTDFWDMSLITFAYGKTSVLHASQIPPLELLDNIFGVCGPFVTILPFPLPIHPFSKNPAAGGNVGVFGTTPMPIIICPSCCWIVFIGPPKRIPSLLFDQPPEAKNLI